MGTRILGIPLIYQIREFPWLTSLKCILWLNASICHLSDFVSNKRQFPYLEYSLYSNYFRAACSKRCVETKVYCQAQGQEKKSIYAQEINLLCHLFCRLFWLSSLLLSCAKLGGFPKSIQISKQKITFQWWKGVEIGYRVSVNKTLCSLMKQWFLLIWLSSFKEEWTCLDPRRPK